MLLAADTVPVVVTVEEVSRFAPLSADMLAVRNFPRTRRLRAPFKSSRK